MPVSGWLPSGAGLRVIKMTGCADMLLRSEWAPLFQPRGSGGPVPRFGARPVARVTRGGRLDRGRLNSERARLNRRKIECAACVVTLLALTVCGGATLGAQAADTLPRLTLDAALSEARAHNAALPVAAAGVRVAQARTQQARGLLYPSVSVATDVHTGVPQGYSSTDAFVRVLGDAPIYSGGQLQANVAQAAAEAEASAFGYRSAVRDVDRAVRADFARVLHADSVIVFRAQALSRLQTYYAAVQARRAGGLGVGADLLQTQQRLALAHAEITAAEREREDAQIALNDDLGRAPLAVVVVAPLPAPTPPSDTLARTPWTTVPDVAQTEALVRAASAGVTAAHAGRKPQVSLEADVGAQPHVGSTAALLNNGQGGGAEVFLSFSLPLYDRGIYAGRLAEANANLQQSQREADVTRRMARLNWMRAATSVAGLYREYDARTQAAAAARDSYLEAESLYRGGQGTALDVLDGYDAWVHAEQDRLDLVYQYRLAQADLIRWGSQ